MFKFCNIFYNFFNFLSLQNSIMVPVFLCTCKMVLICSFWICILVIRSYGVNYYLDRPNLKSSQLAYYKVCLWISTIESEISSVPGSMISSLSFLSLKVTVLTNWKSFIHWSEFLLEIWRSKAGLGRGVRGSEMVLPQHHESHLEACGLGTHFGLWGWVGGCEGEEGGLVRLRRGGV